MQLISGSASVSLAVFGLWPKTSAPCDAPPNGESLFLLPVYFSILFILFILSQFLSGLLSICMVTAKLE